MRPPRRLEPLLSSCHRRPSRLPQSTRCHRLPSPCSPPPPWHPHDRRLYRARLLIGVSATPHSAACREHAEQLSLMSYRRRTACGVYSPPIATHGSRSSRPVPPPLAHPTSSSGPPTPWYSPFVISTTTPAADTCGTRQSTVPTPLHAPPPPPRRPRPLLRRRPNPPRTRPRRRRFLPHPPGQRQPDRDL